MEEQNVDVKRYLVDPAYFIKVTSMTISKALQIFLDVGAVGYSQRTLEVYRDYLKRFIVFTGDKNLEEIKVTDHILKYYRHLEARGVADNTINLSMIALRQMWKTLCGLEKELKIKLPFLWTAIPVRKGIVPRSHRPIEASEFRRMLDNVKGAQGFIVARDTAILLTLYHGGMRVSELTALNVTSLDLPDQSILTVTRKRRDGKAKRRIYLPKEAIVALGTYMDIRQFFGGNDALFIGLRSGKRITTKSIQRIVKIYAKKAGLDPTLFKPHCFRHGWGMRAAKHLMYPLHIKAQLGHTNLSGSEVYFNVTNTALKKEVLRKMDDKVKAPKKSLYRAILGEPRVIHRS